MGTSLFPSVPTTSFPTAASEQIPPAPPNSPCPYFAQTAMEESSPRLILISQCPQPRYSPGFPAYQISWRWPEDAGI